MDWKNLPSSGSVEDRRSVGGVPGGGIAIGGVGGLILALVAMFFGIDLGPILGNSGPPTQQTQGGAQSQVDKETYDFVDRVKTSTDQVWTKIFQKANQTYTKPRLILYSGGTRSGCGVAQSAVGPFYCPLDNSIYIDTSFFKTMQQRLGGGGDFAYSYVIAHEVAHHVQNELGIINQVERRQRSARSTAEKNSYEVRLELQADCFAGVWGRSVQSLANLDQSDLREAISTAQAIGDDNLQMQSRGHVVPESFTHGTSQQRANWFMVGFKSGDPNKCNTFSQPYNQL